MKIKALCFLSILLISSDIYCMRNYEGSAKAVNKIDLINTTPREFRGVAVVCTVSEMDKPNIHATAVIDIPRGGKVPIDLDDLNFWQNSKKVSVSTVASENADIKLKQLHINGQIITIDSPDTDRFTIYEGPNKTIFVR